MHGRLKVALFVSAQPADKHGRLNGSWRTLFTKWVYRDQVDQILLDFKAANPWLQPSHSELDVTFVTSEQLFL
jgi:hypothetical protein